MDANIEKFIDACADTNSLTELISALSGDVDKTDMATWGLSPSEWRDAITKAVDRLKRRNSFFLEHVDYVVYDLPKN